ncbi:DMT family transporter [Sedimentisphaera salicampi]|uniref:Phosphonate utilization associated putative membrane protein n=1 Tax=Sedimentisphaera salicampi TaxID=1941349 RepID=A0A1W6LNG6_9BACT|nr:DMT family transporter [Sedimentisphaera salicampi]ARN57319.1 phosphonate utilization associated putative membrane protein [Sedimentisphaera salicampi]
MWITLGILSSLFLGLYDLSKKHSLQDNAVLPVLFLSTLSGLIVVLPFLFVSRAAPSLLDDTILYIAPLSIKSHLIISAKSFIVAGSWVFGYYALKHLPISIVAPIRATSPFWVLIGAVLIFGESPNLIQLSGVIIIIVSFYCFSVLGRLEGIHFEKNRWIIFTLIAMGLGICSGLYDKYLISRAGYSPIAVQLWFTFYMVLIFGLLNIFLWYPSRKQTTPFRWSISIVLIGVFLILADFAYFTSLSIEGSLLTILAALRRASVLFVFTIGAIIFKEVNKGKKAYALIGVVAGVMLILFGSNG